MPEPTVETLRAVGLAHGLDDVGVARAEVFASTREDLRQRAASGLDGGMAFTYRNPERSTDPGRIVDGARALVVGALGYRRSDQAATDGPRGRVAAYAWEDHYGALRAGLEPIADALREQGWVARVVADDNALVDREAAHRAGLGWYGKNANLLLPGRGSWFVLGSVVTDAPLEPAPEPVPDGCGSCRRCLDGCPTGAIVAPGVVDARRCLAWLVQAPGAFPVEHREALGDRLYGCDDCQSVCPPNLAVERAQGAAPPTSGATSHDLVELLEADDDEVLERHGRWYIAERDPRYVRRNAIVALGNQARPGDTAARALLVDLAQGDDALLAEHADWALARMAERDHSEQP